LPGTVGMQSSQRRRPAGGAGSAELSAEDLQKLDELVAGLTLSRSSVLAAMAFCLDNSPASQQVSQRICASIVDAQPGLTTTQLSARLFLLSDVLFNSHCTKPGASMYRRLFQEFLPDVFERLGEVCDGISPIAAGALRERIVKLLRAWSEWSTFPPQFTKGLEATICCRGNQKPDIASIVSGNANTIDGGDRSLVILQEKMRQWRKTDDQASLSVLAGSAGFQ